MSHRSADRAPWLLVPSILLTLSSVTLLVPRRAAQAAPKPARAAVPAAAAAYDDGEGDELLEHWSDPIVGHEARLQLIGMVVGFVVLGAGVLRRRVWRQPQKAPAVQADRTEHRKAA